MKKEARKVKKNVIILLILALVILVTLIFINNSRRLSNLTIRDDLIIVKKLNVSDIQTLTFDGRDLIGITTNGLMYKIDKETGEIKENCSIEIAFEGLAFKGRELWANSNSQFYVINYNLCFKNGTCNIESGCLKKVWEHKRNYLTRGLAYAKDRFYFSVENYNYDDGIVENYPNMSEKKFSSLLMSFGKGNIAFDGKGVWRVAWGQQNSFILSRYDLQLNPTFGSKEFIMENSGSTPGGLATDGYSLWVSLYGKYPGQDQLYKISPIKIKNETWHYIDPRISERFNKGDKFVKITVNLSDGNYLATLSFNFNKSDFGEGGEMPTGTIIYLNLTKKGFEKIKDSPYVAIYLYNESEKIEPPRSNLGGSACMNARFEIEDSASSCYNSLKKELKINISRGAEDFVPLGIQVVISSNGTAKVFEIRNNSTSPFIKMDSSSNYNTSLRIPNVNEATAYRINTGLQKVTEVGVAPIIKLGNTEKTCDISSRVKISDC